MTIPARPALAKLCHVPSLRAEASLPFVGGRKYRFALRAERRGQNQGLILANGPVPSRRGGNAAGPAEGLFLAIPTSQGARDMNGWPASPFAVRLESPDRRVARGGDLVLDGTRFVKISSSYGSPSSPNYGLGGPQVTTMGFEGLIRRGQTRVNDPLDLRYELHEPMHVYNRYFFADPLPSWLDEGHAIQAQVNAVCGADPRLDTGGWSFRKPGDTDGHTVGSEFFKRLGAAYGCGCAAEVWRDLVDAHGSDRYLTNASATSLVVNVALLDANGLELAARSYRLQPLGMTQVTQVVRDMGVTADVQNAVLFLSTARLDAAFAAYATVIDRATNDPGTLLPR